MKQINWKIGDTIVFKSPTRDGTRKAIRKINGTYGGKYPTVRYNGWSNFAVKLNEIIDIYEK